MQKKGSTVFYCYCYFGLAHIFFHDASYTSGLHSLNLIWRKKFLCDILLFYFGSNLLVYIFSFFISSWFLHLDVRFILTTNFPFCVLGSDFLSGQHLSKLSSFFTCNFNSLPTRFLYSSFLFHLMHACLQFCVCMYHISKLSPFWLSSFQSFTNQM